MNTLNTFEGQTNGAAVSVANSGNSGTALTGVFPNSGTLVYDNTHGSMALLSQGTSGATTFVECTAFGNDVQISTAIDYYMSPTKNATRTLFQLRSPSGTVVSILRTTSDTFRLTDAGGATRWTSSTVFTGQIGTWLRIELQVTSDASAGTMQAAIFTSTGSTALETGTLVTGQNTRGGAITTYRMGKPDSSTDTQSDWFDNIRSQDAILTSLGPYTPANIPPSANAGNDIAGIEPWTTQGVSGVDSDSDGTVVSRSWRQVSGPTVTLVGTGATRTYIAPGTIHGATLVFGYTVTDNNGQVSVESEVTHTVQPVTERAVIGGVEVPVHTSIVSGGELI